MLKYSILWVFFLAALTGQLGAALPSTLNYQGRLLMSGTGAPAPDSSGNTVQFRICAAPNCAGGSDPLWAELWNNGTSHVSTSGGLFNVVLGTYAPLGLAFDQPYFLEVTWTNLSGTPETMLPRQPLTMAPYAFRAKYVDGSFVAKAGDSMSGTLSITASTGLQVAGIQRGISASASAANSSAIYARNTYVGFSPSGSAVEALVETMTAGAVIVARAGINAPVPAFGLNGIGVLASLQGSSGVDKGAAIYAKTSGSGILYGAVIDATSLGVSATASGTTAQAYFGRVSSTAAAAEFINDNSGAPALKVGPLNFALGTGSSGQVLSTDGSNQMSWVNAGGVSAPLSLTNTGAVSTLSVFNSGGGYALYASATAAALAAGVFEGQAAGLSATARSTSGGLSVYGVLGQLGGYPSKGALAYSPNSGGFEYGVFGDHRGNRGAGVYGVANSATASGPAFALWGDSVVNGGSAVFGDSQSSIGNTIGVLGTASGSATGTGVQGSAPGGSGVGGRFTGGAIGVSGNATGSFGIGGYFQGVTGLAGRGTLIGISATASGASGQAFYGRANSVSSTAEFVNDGIGSPIKLNALSFPGGAGTPGQVLGTDGVNQMSWVSAPAPAVPLSLTLSSSVGSPLSVSNATGAAVLAVGATGLAAGGSAIGVSASASAAAGVGGFFQGASIGASVQGFYTGLSVTSTGASSRAIFAQANSTLGTIRADNAIGTALGGNSSGATGIGVSGNQISTSNTGYGVSGSNSSTTGNSIGVRGSTSSSTGWAVYGENLVAGNTGAGIYGTNSSINGNAVVGLATGAGAGAWGVVGDSTSGIGVVGIGTVGAAGKGTSIGVSATASNAVSNAINAQANTSGTYPAVYSKNYGTGPAYYGESSSGDGIYAVATSTAAVGMRSKGGWIGVSATVASAVGQAFYGRANSASPTAEFVNDGAGSALKVGPLNFALGTGSSGQVLSTNGSNQMSWVNTGGVSSPLSLTNVGAASALSVFNTGGGNAGYFQGVTGLVVSSSALGLSITAGTAIYVSGRVGIGVLPPAFALETRDPTFTEARFGAATPAYILDGQPTFGFNLFYDSAWRYGDTGYAAGINFDPASGKLYFINTIASGTPGAGAAPSTRLTLDSAGNLGIGNTAPSNRLSIFDGGAGAYAAYISAPSGYAAAIAGSVVGLSVTASGASSNAINVHSNTTGSFPTVYAQNDGSGPALYGDNTAGTGSGIWGYVSNSQYGVFGQNTTLGSDGRAGVGAYNSATSTLGNPAVALDIDGGISVNATGRTDHPADWVLCSSPCAVSNNLAEALSIILLTPEHTSPVSLAVDNLADGSFTIRHNAGTSIYVHYLIITRY